MGLIGKIGLFFILVASVFGAKLEISNTEIVAGERVVFKLSANGQDVKFPQIDDIDGFVVSKGGVQRSSSSYTKIINGKIQRENKNIFSQSYAFFPNKDITIPAFIVEVDGKEEYTKPFKIKIISQDQMDKKIPYKVSLHVDNQNPYVGEVIKIFLQIRLDERLDVGDVRLGKNDFGDLFVDDKPVQSGKNENGYKILNIEYWARALKKGDLEIKPFEVLLGFAQRERDIFSIFGQNYDYKTIRSNPLTLHVKALPKGVSAVGDFKIDAKVDKTSTNAGKPVNVEVSISGIGGLGEIESLKKEVENATIYDDKPILKTQVENGVYKSKWSQKLAYVGTKDFTIEPFIFKFLDPRTNKVKIIQTKPIKVKVQGELSKSVEVWNASIEKPLETKFIVKKEGINWLWLILAFFLGMVTEFILFKIKRAKLKKTKLFKNQRDILQEILHLKGKNEELDGWIEKLENNIYGGDNHKINKKAIGKILKKLYI